MTQLLPPKKEVALALLERSNVDVYLDPRAKGVVVPPQFRKEPRLILKIGLNMPVPIPDLRLDEESMSCTLSFNRSPFYCVVPWSSVFAMVGEDGRGMVWPDDVPQELAVKVVDPGDAAGANPAGLKQAPRVEPVERAPEGPRAEGSGAAGATTSTGARRNGRANKLADDTADRPSAARGGGGSKRKKKKEEESPRPALFAVPPLTPASAPSSSARENGEAETRARSSEEAAGERDRPHQIRRAPEQQRRQGAPHPRDGVSPIPQAPSGASSRPRQPPPSQRRPPDRDDGRPSDRPKRELPPYLRVVK